MHTGGGEGGSGAPLLTTGEAGADERGLLRRIGQRAGRQQDGDTEEKGEEHNVLQASSMDWASGTCWSTY